MKFKKKIIVFIISVFLVACASQSASKESAPAEVFQEEAVTMDARESQDEEAGEPFRTNTESILDYFPFKADLVKIYKDEQGNEITSFTQFMTDDRIQFANRRNNTDTIVVYEKAEDEIRVVFQKQDINYRENFIENTDFVGTYLRGPVEIGTSWVNADNKEAVITKTDVNIEGYKCIEVSTDTDVYYYGYQVGLVKQIKNIDFSPAKTELTSIHENQSTEIDLLIYTYNSEVDTWEQRPVSYLVVTNDEVKDLLKHELVISNIINENTEIHSLSKKSSDNRVYLDVSAQIYDGLKDRQEEYLRLQSLVRSIGFIYGTNEIYLWVDGMAYEGPYIKMVKNELLKVAE